MARNSPLDARSDDPWIGVHVLTEFVFCPRAGLMAYEEQDEDQGVEAEDRGPRLDYIPRWEMHSIERALNLLTEQVKSELAALKNRLAALRVVGIIAVLSALIIGVITWSVLYAMIPLGGLLLTAMILVVRLWGSIETHRGQIEELGAIRDLAQKAEPREPNPEQRENQAVNWWSLWRAGFESIVYKEPLRFEPWRLAGRPWRVLRRGSLRIPVFRKRTSVGGDQRRLYRQHYARMAAYCHLLEKCEGAESPYGIVLFGDGSYEGIAVAMDSPGSWTPLRNGLTMARQMVCGWQERKAAPAYPNHQGMCRHCKLGKPFVHRPGETEHRQRGRIIKPHTISGVDSRKYHSKCGDRFRWIPPHEKAYEKGLYDDGDD
ncbi:MAG: hypothetical protein PVJ57_03695 [Phycisphaerae bacterium]|jgi:hypothetical protein